MVGLSTLIILSIFSAAWIGHGGINDLKQKIKNKKQ